MGKINVETKIHKCKCGKFGSVGRVFWLNGDWTEFVMPCQESEEKALEFAKKCVSEVIDRVPEDNVLKTGTEYLQ